MIKIEKRNKFFEIDELGHNSFISYNLKRAIFLRFFSCLSLSALRDTKGQEKSLWTPCAHTVHGLDLNSY